MPILYRDENLLVVDRADFLANDAARRTRRADGAGAAAPCHSSCRGLSPPAGWTG